MMGPPHVQPGPLTAESGVQKKNASRIRQSTPSSRREIILRVAAALLSIPSRCFWRVAAWKAHVETALDNEREAQ